MAALLKATGAEQLPHTWKELDVKFLSNDTQTKAEKNQQPVTPWDRLEHILHHSSLYIRASDLILYLEHVGVAHLKQQFQIIVDAIFGTSKKYPTWSLRSITKTANQREADVVLKLLGADGPLVSLATRLLEDPSFIVEVELEKLPFALSQRMFQGDIPPYFSSRLWVTDLHPQTGRTAPMIKCLKVNSFEFFFLSFTAHICARKGTGNTSDYLVGWGNLTNNLYNNLLSNYLSYFFPCDGHGVPSDNFRFLCQPVNDSIYATPNLTSHMMNYHIGVGGSNSEVSKTPRLIKASFLLEQGHPAPRGDTYIRKSQPQKEVWRTETILLICTEIWMAHAPDVATFTNSSPVITDQFGKVMLPTVDVVKAVRMLVRHSHFFLNCITSSVMHPLEDVKRDIYPTYQKRLYKFTRHLIYNWPLDNSFRIVYETWLSYVQPWRYTQYEKIRTPNSNEEEPIDPRWYGFIQENVLFYSRLFNIILARMSRLDFATTNNALMLYRVAKVFTGPEYLKRMMVDIESVLLNYEQEQPYNIGRVNEYPYRASSSPTYSSSVNRFASSGGSQKGSAIFRVASLKQTMKDWEHADFIYEPLFSEGNRRTMFGLIELARRGKNQLQEIVDATLAQQKRDHIWWNKVFGTRKTSDVVVGQSLSEVNKAISQLDAGLNQFATLFDIPIIEKSPPASPAAATSRLQGTTLLGSSFVDTSFLEGTEDRVTVLPSGTFNCDMLIPIGNPDFACPRGDECATIVYIISDLSGYLNEKFAGYIMRTFFKRGLLGRLARATFAGPIEYFDIERKRGGHKEKIKKVLPPRISLRFVGSINFICFLAAFFAVCVVTGYDRNVIPGILIVWLIFILICAATEPKNKLDDLIFLFGDRNYNVDFRGRYERNMAMEQRG